MGKRTYFTTAVDCPVDKKKGPKVFNLTQSSILHILHLGNVMERRSREELEDSFRYKGPGGVFNGK